MTTHARTKINSTPVRPHRVFVYGSLLAGLGNHRVLTGHDARMVAHGTTAAARFTMFDLGSFPGCVESGSTAVRGEVYDINDAGMASLDQLEGYPTFYDRARVAIRLADGTTTFAWVYLLADAYAERRNGYLRDEVPNGDWRARVAARRSLASAYYAS